MDPKTIESLAQDVEHLGALRALNPKSLLVTPLIAHGKLRGAICLVSGEQGRGYTQKNAQFFEEIASRMALASEGARLFRETQRAVRTREEVLAIVSHDLKNPLAAVSMTADLLLRSDRLEGVQLRNKAIRIQNSVRQMETLIGDLLDFAKIQSGTFSVEIYRVNLLSVFLPLRDVFQSLADAKRLLLDIEISPRLPEVAGDSSRIGQVLSNLLGNAIKFTPEGGTVRLLATESEEGILVSVSDTGPGIPSEQISKIFDRFWQAKESKHLGSGLGLAIAKGIIEAHGTRIWAESQIGKGSQFFFTLPLATAETRVRDLARAS